MRTIKLKDNNYWDTSSIMHNKINLKQLLNSIFPIGKVELFYDNLDHSNYFGFTWERCSLERSPIGFNPNSSDDNYKIIGNQFGEKKHTLTVAELPKDFPKLQKSIAYDSGNTDAGFSAGEVKNYSTNEYKLKLSQDVFTSTGNGEAHNTIHPVEVMAFWRRVS